jgi:hypothetical protein
VNISHWVYEADSHCWDCASKRFGSELFEVLNNKDCAHVSDSEGNPLTAVMDWQSEHGPEGLSCGTCGEWIVEPFDDVDVQEMLEDLAGISGFDEQAGDSCEGTGWAAIFRFASVDLREAKLYGMANEHADGVTFILYEGTLGCRSHDVFTDRDEADAHWARVVADLEPDNIERLDDETGGLFDGMEA